MARALPHTPAQVRHRGPGRLPRALVCAATLLAVAFAGALPAAPATAGPSTPVTVAAAARKLTATPTPTISGTARVGSTLTAKPGTWKPAPVTLSYRWYRGTAAITGATRPAYKVTTADAGKTLTVRVTGKKTGYTTVTKTSAGRTVEKLLTATPTPTITGTARAGYTLTAKAGTWSPSPVTLTYRWYRGTTAIANATRSTYLVTPADAGASLTVRVTGTKTGYTPVTKTSPGRVIERPLTATPTPTITGTPVVGSVLTAVAGTWSPAPVKLAYQWYRGATAITGATASGYTLTATDAGATLTVRVTGTRTGYTPVAKTSVPVGPIQSPLTATPTPTIQGNPIPGATLEVVTGNWAPQPITLTYQWLRDGAAIPDATTAWYTVTAEDTGNRLSVAVTGTRPGHTPVTRTSASTAPTSAVPTYVSHGVSTDTTWTAETTPLVIVAGEFRVAQGATLTIGPGVTVAFTEGTNVPLHMVVPRLVVDGDLQVQGTADDPVVFTHVNETLGGQVSTGEFARWEGIQVWGTASLSHAQVHWTLTAIDASSGSGTIAVRDSTFEGNVYLTPATGAVVLERTAVSYGQASVSSSSDSGCTVRDNTFAPTASDTMVLYVGCGDIRPGQLSGNTSTKPSIAQVTGGLDEDWDLPSLPGLRWSLADVTVRDGATITVPAGATMYGSGILQLTDGSLVAAGTTTAPVTLAPYTYWSDETDAFATEPFCVDTRGGTLRLAHTQFQGTCDGQSILTRNRHWGESGDTAVLTDTELAGDLDITATTITLERNTVHGRIAATATTTLTAGANTVDPAVRPGDPGTPAIDLSADVLKLAGLAGTRSLNAGTITVTGALDQPWTVPKLTGLSWAGLNITIGTAANAATVTLPAGLPVAAATMWVRNGTLDLRGTAASPVTLKDASISAYRPGTDPATTRRILAQSARLTGASWIEASDTEVLLDDVTITQSGAPVDAGHGPFCLNLGNGTTGHLRGALSGCAVGVQSHSAQEFDARYVNWGGDAPIPFGGAVDVIGNVAVVPWDGYVAPPTPPTPPGPANTTLMCKPYMVIAVRGSGETPGGPLAMNPDAYDHFTYTQMTEETHPSTIAPNERYAYAYRGLGAKVQTILTGQELRIAKANGIDEPWLVEDKGPGLLDELQFDVDDNVNVMPLIYPADDTAVMERIIQPSDAPPLFHTVDLGYFHQYLSSIAVGVDRLTEQLHRINDACPNSRISLFGYSQGAMVIHMALADIGALRTPDDGEILRKINAVGLLADPLHDPGANEMVYLGSAPSTARALVTRLLSIGAGRDMAEDLNTAHGGRLGGMFLPYPATLSQETISYCSSNDMFCDPDIRWGADLLGTGGAVHVGYNHADQLVAVSWLAAQFFPEPTATP